MIERIVTDVFHRIEHMWKSERLYFVPSEDDVRKVLDKAAETLYDEPIGTQLQTGGLIIEKAPKGYDVYVFTGNYK